MDSESLNQNSRQIAQIIPDYAVCIHDRKISAPLVVGQDPDRGVTVFCYRAFPV
jgi:hypothetical protein